MTNYKFEVGQKLEIYGLPDIGGDFTYNGEIVVVVALPGYNKALPKAYGVLRKSGDVMPAVETYLRPFPPKLPNGRGDTDEKVTWDEFDKATNLKSIVFRRGNPDY